MHPKINEYYIYNSEYSLSKHDIVFMLESFNTNYFSGMIVYAAEGNEYGARAGQRFSAHSESVLQRLEEAVEFKRQLNFSKDLETIINA